MPQLVMLPLEPVVPLQEVVPQPQSLDPERNDQNNIMQVDHNAMDVEPDNLNEAHALLALLGGGNPPFT